MKVLLADLQDRDYTYTEDSQELARLAADYCPDEEEPTGAVVLVGDGDYDEVWFNWSPKPYLLSAMYERYL